MAADNVHVKPLPEIIVAINTLLNASYTFNPVLIAGFKSPVNVRVVPLIVA